MSLLGDLRGRVSGRNDEPAPAPDADGSGPDEATGAPFKGYDRMDSRKLTVTFHGYSQAQLAEIEDYERAHQNRLEVLQKLRFMRGAQPLEGYDDLSPEQIADQLQRSDLVTIKRVRDYERKFANRKEVLDVATEMHKQALAARPPQKPPAYQAGGGSHDSI